MCEMCKRIEEGDYPGGITEEDFRAAAAHGVSEMLDVIETYPGKEDEDVLARWVLSRSHVDMNEIYIDAYCAGVEPIDLMGQVMAAVLLAQSEWPRMRQLIADGLEKRAHERVCEHQWSSPALRLLEDGNHFMQTCERCGEERRV